MHLAIDHIRRRALDADRAVRDRLGALGLVDAVPTIVETIRSRARLTVNFHPDRRDRHGRTVAAGLLADGRYRSQHETGISNGGRSAVPGGMRTRWETELFAGAYCSDPAADASTRPIYGALDLTNDPHGGSPRFGSSYLVLDRACLHRATLCVGDSHTGPTDVGTIDALLPILAGVFDAAAGGDGLGRGLSIDELIVAFGRDADGAARVLDHYVEAQIHAGIDLTRDVVEIVIDPSFDGSTVADDLEAAGSLHGFLVRSHGGSILGVDATPSDFRGPEMPELAHRTDRGDGCVDAASIGHAMADVPFSAPSETGDPEGGPLQQYKRLWHCVLRCGFDAERQPRVVID